MMKLAAVVWCLMPWICAVFFATVAGVDLREGIKQTAFLFFMLWPIVMAVAILLFKDKK